MDRADKVTDAERLKRTPRHPEAFGIFYRRHIADVVGYFRRRTDSAELALDLAAETFARALETAPRFSARDAPAAAWLFAIARNLLTDSYRRGRVEDAARVRLQMQPLTITDVGAEMIEALTGAADAVQAIALDDTLPADQAQAIRAHMIDERPYAELAAELGCSAQVVRQRVSRGLRSLRRKVEDR